ncbi:response regulator [Oscillatoria sp. FACHB-1407]|uniref:hybrid sensor histidine kinase/response regulator n=1 Tax=Oscillatoria sp. FACHB-1407 TaxID=2692847 RepID=UPI001683E1D9|nr:response regulator [Oscillatoria sp. FACHB-1407]MBD2463468.1 response regulator [Oscillatoria sp. FACHB-1407]
MTALLQSTDQINILVVDDTLDNLRLLGKILESQNYTVLKSLNGRMALQAAHRNPPDLILLDINMPEMNGYEVCQQLKASEVTAHIPIIFISALDQVNDKVRAFEMGGQDYITKPFQELEVLARVRNQLLIQQQKRQLQQEIETRKQAESQVRQLNTILERLNADLERQVQLRTLELQQALNFEVALKHISDQVRDSLDQHKILQVVVETLAITLEVRCCDTALYNADHSTSTIRYQWVQPVSNATQGQMLYTQDFPELYAQLENRLCFAFCQTQPSPIRNHSATLACPIFDDQVDQVGILGDLWLFRDTFSSFSESEIHLVQQVANQCAIALRQARLYEAAQAQVKELERLNQLKDDFLSTISHELRTPIASMKMVLKLLTAVTDEGKNFIEEISKSPAQDNKVIQYFKVLQEECDRELALVEDLLNLQQIEAGTYRSQLTSIALQDLVSHLVEPFQIRTQNQQQILQINFDPNLPILNLDLFSFNRVVTELLNNAFKYTPAGGTISISAHMIPETTATSPAQYLELTITNTGVEIAPNELSRIFDKFYRVPNSDPWKYGGTGLGLALVKKLVEQMGGAIEVESASNQTSFKLHLLIFS